MFDIKISLFFDNDIKNFNLNMLPYYDNSTKLEKHCPCIVGIKTQGYSPYIKLDINFDSYLKTLTPKGRNFGNLIKKYIGRTYDKNSGIQTNEIFELMKVIKENNYIRNIIFDWDRTITLHEGIPNILGPGYKNIINYYKDIIAETNYLDFGLIDIAEYYFGGFDRIAALQILFEFLQENNINIYILTANILASEPINRKFYFDILNVIGIKLNENNLIFSKNKHKIIKKLLQNDEDKLCNDKIKNYVEQLKKPYNNLFKYFGNKN